MENAKVGVKIEEDESEIKITPQYLLALIRPVMEYELVAKTRSDKKGLRVKLWNGQKFFIRVEEV